MAKRHAPIVKPSAKAKPSAEPLGTDPVPEAAPVPDSDAAPVVTPRDPRTTIGVETATGVSYELIADPEWRNDRRILLRGQNFEHSSTDADGVWIYRSM